MAYGLWHETSALGDLQRPSSCKSLTPLLLTVLIDMTDERRYRVSDSAALAVRSEEARPTSDRL